MKIPRDDFTDFCHQIGISEPTVTGFDPTSFNPIYIDKSRDDDNEDLLKVTIHLNGDIYISFIAEFSIHTLWYNSKGYDSENKFFEYLTDFDLIAIWNKYYHLFKWEKP